MLFVRRGWSAAGWTLQASDGTAVDPPPPLPPPPLPAFIVDCAAGELSAGTDGWRAEEDTNESFLAAYVAAHPPPA